MSIYDQLDRGLKVQMTLSRAEAAFWLTLEQHARKRASEQQFQEYWRKIKSDETIELCIALCVLWRLKDTDVADRDDQLRTYLRQHNEIVDGVLGAQDLDDSEELSTVIEDHKNSKIRESAFSNISQDLFRHRSELWITSGYLKSLVLPSSISDIGNLLEALTAVGLLAARHRDDINAASRGVIIVSTGVLERYYLDYLAALKGDMRDE